MAKKFYQTEEFLTISTIWEKKLEEEGLADIEKEIGGKRALKQKSSNVYRQMDPIGRETKELYFQQIGVCLYQASFDCEVDKIVMGLKADGAKIAEICKELARRGMRRYRRTVRLIIRKYEDRWGIRTWTPEQLKYRWKRKVPTP